ncbi:TPA: Rib/alpha-like domain-containing protein [Staphylococcus pseudintermedius]
MNKSKEKQFNFLSKRQNRYVIRRFSAGIASVLVGTALFLSMHTSEASAAEQNQTSGAKQIPPDVSNTSDPLTGTNEKAAQAPTTATNSSTEEVNQKETDLNAPSEVSTQTAEQSNEVKPTEMPISEAASTPEAPVKEQPKDAQATDESNNVAPKNDTGQQANHETSTRNAQTTDETTTEEIKTKASTKEEVTEENVTEKTPQDATSHSEKVPKNEKDATESTTSETSTTKTSTINKTTHKQESPSLEKTIDQTQMNTTQLQITEAPKLTEEEREDLFKDYANKQNALKPAAIVKTRNQSDKVNAPSTKAWPSDIVPESEVEILADAIANGYISSATDATNAAHTLSGRAWVLGHGTLATMANGLKPVPEGTQVHLQWIDTDGATSPIYTAKTTNRLSSVDGSQVGPGAYAFDLRDGWTDANGKHHLYSATKGQRYQLWIDDFRTKEGNINTMLRVSGGFTPGTFVDSVTHNNMGQFPLIGTNMQRTGIFMTTLPSEAYLTAKHVVNDLNGATANPAVTMIEDDFVSGKIWIETGYGDYSNSATGPNFNLKDKAAVGYKVVMTSLTSTGAKAYDADVNRLPEKDRAAAVHKLLTAHPEYMSVTVVGTTNERGEYTLRFPEGTLNKDHVYGYVLNPNGNIVTSYSGFTSTEFRRPNYDLATAPQTAPYYRPIRNAWVNVNFAVTEATHAQINIKNFDVMSHPGHRGQAVYVDIIDMPHTSLPTRIQWKDSAGKVVQNSEPVTSKAEAESEGKFTIPTDAKSGDVYTVELVVGDNVTASDSLIVHVNEDAAKYQPAYLTVTVEPGQSATVPAPKNADGKTLPNGTTFEKGHHVPTWVTVNSDGSITVKPGKQVAEDDYEIPVIVTYPDGSRNTIFTPVTVQEKEPVASVGDENQLLDGTVEGQAGVGATVTYPDGTTDHITVPVVTQNQPDGDKYGPTATGVTKKYGEPVTSKDVTDSIHIPNFPEDGQQPITTVEDETQLPDGTTDHIQVPVWTNKQLDKDKYKPTSVGVTKKYGEPVTSIDVTGSIHIPNFPEDDQQPTPTVDDVTTVAQGHETDASATKNQQSVGDNIITIPTVAHGSTQANHDGENASNQANEMTEKVTPVTTTIASVATGDVVPTPLSVAPHAQVTQAVGTSAETTAKEEVQQLPETGENNKQAGVLVGGVIMVISGLLLFGRRRNFKID